MSDEYDAETLRALRSSALRARSSRDPQKKQALLIEIGLAEPELVESAGPISEAGEEEIPAEYLEDEIEEDV